MKPSRQVKDEPNPRVITIDVVASRPGHASITWMRQGADFELMGRVLELINMGYTVTVSKV